MCDFAFGQIRTCDSVLVSRHYAIKTKTIDSLVNYYCIYCFNEINQRALVLISSKAIEELVRKSIINSIDVSRLLKNKVPYSIETIMNDFDNSLGLCDSGYADRSVLPIILSGQSQLIIGKKDCR